MIPILVNHASRLASRPVGLPTRANFDFTEEPVDEAGPDEVLVRVLYILVDPAMRGWLLEIARPEAGRTVAVSGAAGAVGHLVGQIARLGGVRAGRRAIAESLAEH